MFKPEVLAAMVALISATVSVAATIYTNRLLARTKAIEVKLQIRREIATRLLDCRIECYPELFEKISTFIKKIDYGQLNIEDVKELLEDISRWDSRNAIFYTSDTASIAMHARKFLADILESNKKEKAFDLASSMEKIRSTVVRDGDSFEIRYWDLWCRFHERHD
jgi:hypothetical protein